ncbi:MAG: GNAT family N-acetyltransferase [Oscillospiraceae bacterium]|nr:GNAT family N-acetyltransferase [Oscillospiraceae bacterium]
MQIRTAHPADLPRLIALEQAGFPTTEAATESQMKERLAAYPDHFWVLLDGERPVSLVDGMVTDEPHLTDAMYADASMHRENGRWQMIFGVVTDPEYRCRGCAETLLRYVIEQARRQGRSGLVLTCKEKLIHYYAKFGFVNEGVSSSEHGGVQWYEMRLTF